MAECAPSHYTIGRLACSCGQRGTSFPSGQFIYQVTSTTVRTCSADWCLHPQVIEQIWVRFFRAQVDLFANRQNTCCPLWFSLGCDNPPLGIDALGHQWPALRLYAFPPIPLLQQVLCRIA